MFGKKKMYKKGLADAMNAYQDFGSKQEEALAAIREEVREGKVQLEDALSKLDDKMVGIFDYLDAKEKAALYHLNTPYDIRKLEESEQRLLVAVLYQLAEDEGNRLNDYQRTYIHGVQRYLGISNPQVGLDDLSVVGDIDSGIAQKAILQTVLEFFYLQEGDEITDDQEEFLSNFSVNKKQATAIENTVSRLFNAVGVKGLSEKYGNDEVNKQADDAINAAVHTFKANMHDRMHVFASGFPIIRYDSDQLWHFAGAYDDSDSYKSESKCQSEARRQLERTYREIEKQMMTYTKRSGDHSIYKSMIDSLDSRIEDRRKDLAKIQSPKVSSIVSQIEKYLKKTTVAEKATDICDRLADEYSLSEVNSYYSEIEYDVNDPSEFESGVAAIIAKAFKTYGYNANGAASSICDDATENLTNFKEDLEAEFNDLISTYIVDPIQDLISDLQEALCNSDEV